MFFILRVGLVNRVIASDDISVVFCSLVCVCLRVCVFVMCTYI